MSQIRGKLGSGVRVLCVFSRKRARPWPVGQLCGLFLTSLEGEAANSSERSGNSARCHGAVSSCLATERRSPTLVLHLFSFPNLTKPQKSKMTPKKPVIGLCKPSPRLRMGLRAVSLLLLTQVCLPGSRVPVSLPRNLRSPQIYALGRQGIYGTFITHPTPGLSTSPCSCQNHPLVPSRASSSSPRETTRK